MRHYNFPYWSVKKQNIFLAGYRRGILEPLLLSETLIIEFLTYSKKSVDFVIMEFFNMDVSNLEFT